MSISIRTIDHSDAVTLLKLLECDLLSEATASGTPKDLDSLVL